MAESPTSVQKATLAISSASVITSAIALLSKRSSVVEASGPMSLDDATMQLLIALAASSDRIDNTLNQLMEFIQSNQGVSGPPEYPNNHHTVSFSVVCQQANTPYRVPECDIPPGRNFVVKGYPTNAGLIYVATGAAPSANWQQAWPLMPNEPVGYRIQNANVLWVSAQVAGDIAVCTVEQDS